MFGAIGAVLFGAICAVAWSSDETAEQKRRRYSQEKNNDTYFDKNGNLRHTNNGRKLTREEIWDRVHVISNPKPDKYNYYDVFNIYTYKHEIFETREEAYEYANIIYKDKKHLATYEPINACVVTDYAKVNSDYHMNCDGVDVYGNIVKFKKEE